jgi:Cytochrome P460
MSRIRSSVLSPKTIPAVVFIAVVLAGFGQMALATQDKHTVAVPGGLSFAEFKGYEGWQVVNISHSEKLLAVTLGNPAMIDAYKAAIPADGKPVPDGARMAKIHYVPKVREEIPGQPTVPGTLHDIDLMVKDSKRFPDSGAGVMAYLNTTRPPTRSDPATRMTRRRKHTMPSAASRATPSFRQMTTFSQSMRSGNHHRSYWERS